jgi:hypothetical protein
MNGFGGGDMKKLVAVMLLLVASTAYGEIYTWKDARGTLFYTNSLYEIPARYRARAKLLDVATGKKVPIGTALPGAPAGPGAAQPSPAAPPTATAPQGPGAQAPAQAATVQPRPEPPAQPSPQLATPQGGAAKPQPRVRRRARSGSNEEE